MVNVFERVGNFFYQVVRGNEARRRGKIAKIDTQPLEIRRDGLPQDTSTTNYYPELEPGKQDRLTGI